MTLEVCLNYKDSGMSAIYALMTPEMGGGRVYGVGGWGGGNGEITLQG